MTFREIINGSFEPLWRFNARRDADAFKAELWVSPTRRRFLAGLGVALLHEYLDMRRAVAFPHGAAARSVVLGQITNARTGLHYNFIPDALAAMQSGDTILLPAGPSYSYLGVSYDYANYRNTDSRPYSANSGFNSMYLGSAITSAAYGGWMTADYGTLQGTGATNNGRPLISPPYGILAQNFVNGDTVLFLGGGTSVANFRTSGSFQVLGNYNFGQFANVEIDYTGVDLVHNSFTGVTGGPVATIPAGVIVSQMVPNGQAPFFTIGQNPGWTFTNIEIGYTAWAGSRSVVSSIQQGSSLPSGPQVGSVTLNNCYIHDCKMGPGLGYTGYGPVGTFLQMFDTELTQMGAYATTDSATHNAYVGHMGELLMDNCYSHNTCGTWLVKSRAALNVLRYCQIRGERTDSNPSAIENSGIDLSNGGLSYVIGCIHQQSLKAASWIIDYAAEVPASGNTQANPLQELYVVNGTMVGPANSVGFGTNPGTGRAPIAFNNLIIHNPEMPTMSQAAGGTMVARQYYASNTVLGTGGGESSGSYLTGDVGSGTVWDSLQISANNLVTVASPFQHTGALTWNCYLNYGDPILYLNFSSPQVQSGNLYFWDAGLTQPVFSQTSGGNLISVTGTLTNGNSNVTGLTGLVGLAAIAQLLNLSVYVGGVATGLRVASVNAATGALTMNGPFVGSSGAATITFGYYLYCGITYAHALGDSVLGALQGFNPTFQGAGWFDAAYVSQTIRANNGCTIQVEPGNRLIVNAPPTGPSWATGVNFWATVQPYNPQWGYLGADNTYDAGLIGLSKQTPTQIGFGGSWTSPVGIFSKAQELNFFYFLQNASPLTIGTPFTEPTSGIVNLNPTRTKLQWFRRAATNQGGMDCWYTVVPGGGLTSYTDTIYLESNGSPTLQGQISVWRGCAANPFDANFPVPVSQATSSASVTTAAGNVTVLSAIRTFSGHAGSGFTQIGTANLLNAAYESFVSAQTGLTVSQTGGSAGDPMMVDALAGASSAPTLVSSFAINASSVATINFTIPSANAGDVIYLMLCENNGVAIVGIGQIAMPPLGTGVNASTQVLVQNCIIANYNSAAIGGGLVINGGNNQAMPAGWVVETTNLKANPFNGSTFGSPTWSTVFSDPNQADYVYILAGGSPALNAASNPGSSPEGQSLIPTFQSSWNGLPTPGTPIPAKTPRSDIGPALTGSQGALA